MIFRAWDEPNRFTDIDAGITAADTAGENLTVVLAPLEDGHSWGLWRDTPTGFDGFGRIVWGVDVIAEGTADTREQAEAAGEAAKETHQRSLIRG